MTVEYTVISIGTLSHNHLWGESSPSRTPHATTTFVTDGDRRILVDPGLPPAVLEARFNERTGRRLADVTDVFCTTLRPAHRRGASAMPHARWWCGEAEREWSLARLDELAASADRLRGEELQAVREDRKVVERFRPAPERFGRQTEIFPVAGPSPGCTGLILTPQTRTIVIAGDAALTAEHVLRAQAWEGCEDAEASIESLRSILEIADIIVPGHDNILFSAGQW
jgi:glyoxylase-like metal-dependent hydrolase (beta-lactamase superfamily II)